MLVRALILIVLLLGVSGVANADCQGDFTPIIGTGSPFSQVHQFPKDGNQFMIAGKTYTIPPAVGVISGGVVGTYNDASIDKVLHQTLAPNTLYFAYDYIIPGNSTPVMDFSTTGHREDPIYGNEVHATDRSRSLVGLVYTDENGKFRGDGIRQLTLSWCHPIRASISTTLANISTTSPTFVVPDGAPQLEWLEWGVNSSFPEGMDTPNVHALVTLVSDTAGACSWLGISFDGAPPHPTSPVNPVSGSVHPVANAGITVPALAMTQGSSEGHHTAQIMLSNGGSEGCPSAARITIMSGKLYTDPLRS